MFVRIKAGTYGYRDEKGFLKPKNRGEVIDLDDAEAKRIIDLGIAEEYATEATETTLPGVSEASPIGHTQGDEKAMTEPEGEGIDIESLNFEQLKSVAEQIGVQNIGKFRSKKALIDAISEAGLGAAEPEVE